jgi:hypothetical protein
MAPQYRWQDPEGRATVKKIIKKLVPEWKDGLHDWQLILVIRILDGEDVLCCTATGDGRSAIFAAPIIVLHEMSQNASQYPNLPYCLHPIGLIVTPTKGLSGNIVSDLVTCSLDII